MKLRNVKSRFKQPKISVLIIFALHLYNLIGQNNNYFPSGCDQNRYGVGCTKICPFKCKNRHCDAFNGSCAEGCADPNALTVDCLCEISLYFVLNRFHLTYFWNIINHNFLNITNLNDSTIFINKYSKLLLVSQCFLHFFFYN